MANPKAIAIIGGGITGATCAQALSKYDNLTLHLFDQGRRGVGGRTSSRSAATSSIEMRWDHGCQFFRADTPQFQHILEEWVTKGFVREWKGNFASSTTLSADREFFGLPSTPPFYVGSDGMQSIAQNVLKDVNQRMNKVISSSFMQFTGTRVASMERDESTKLWRLLGTTGDAAYHDTPEALVRQNKDGIQQIGNTSGYDAVILTDVSSSFESWHRASAGVPDQFAKRVRERVGARVPLFTAMIAFDKVSNIPFDAASFDNEVIWFAAKSNSKPGMEDGRECWTLVSTPEYAMTQIEETPMQDPTTGEFIPQSSEYLTTVPGPDLLNAFRSQLCNKKGILGSDALNRLPEIIHVDAQRWGSAMPCHRHLDDESSTRKVIVGVPYDSGRFALAPTKQERDGDKSFLIDESLMLIQAGDMMSSYTPGFEGAVLSGYDVAQHLHELLCNSG